MAHLQGAHSWEDASGIEHHCAICQTPLHNPSAMKTCIGIHCVPCWRFHYSLQGYNRPQRCRFCHMADERHELRHREIAQTLKHLDGNLTDASGPARTPLRPAAAAILNASMISTPSTFSGKNKTLDSHSPSENLRKRDKKEIKRAMKALTRAEHLTTQEVERIWDVLHPSAENDWNDIRGQAIAAIALTAQDPDVTCDLERIFEAFCVSSDHQPSDKDRRALLHKLERCVVEDLKQYQLEALGIVQRREEFLRWANRTALERVFEHHEARDWKPFGRIRNRIAKPPAGPSEGDSSSDSESEDTSLSGLFNGISDQRHLVNRPGRGFGWSYDGEDGAEDDSDSGDKSDEEEDEDDTEQESLLRTNDSTSDKGTSSHPTHGRKRGVNAIPAGITGELSRALDDVEKQLDDFDNADFKVISELGVTLGRIEQDLALVKKNLAESRTRLSSKQKQLKATTIKTQKRVERLKNLLIACKQYGDFEQAIQTDLSFDKDGLTAVKFITTLPSDTMCQLIAFYSPLSAEKTPAELLGLLQKEALALRPHFLEAQARRPGVNFETLWLECISSAEPGSKLGDIAASLLSKSVSTDTVNNRETSRPASDANNAVQFPGVAASTSPKSAHVKRVVHFPTPRPSVDDEDYTSCPCCKYGQDSPDKWVYVCRPDIRISAGPMPFQHARMKQKNGEKIRATHPNGNDKYVITLDKTFFGMPASEYADAVMIVDKKVACGPFSKKYSSAHKATLEKGMRSNHYVFVFLDVYDWLADPEELEIPQRLVGLWSKYTASGVVTKTGFAVHVLFCMDKSYDEVFRCPEKNHPDLLMECLESLDWAAHAECPCCTKISICICGIRYKPGEELYECQMADCGIGDFHVKCMGMKKLGKDVPLPVLDPVTNEWSVDVSNVSFIAATECFGKTYCPACLRKLRALAATV